MSGEQPLNNLTPWERHLFHRGVAAGLFSGAISMWAWATWVHNQWVSALMLLAHVIVAVRIRQAE